MAMSPKDIQLIIDNATVNSQSTVEWVGNGGLKKVLTEINNNSVIRGVLSFADTTSMSLAGGTDGQYATCVVGTNIIAYRYYANIDTSVLGAISSQFGGQWRPISAVDPTERLSLGFSLTVSISDTGKTILFPTTVSSTGYVVMIQPTNTYTANFQATIGYFIDNKTTTGFQLRFVSPAVADGTFSADCLIIF